MFETEMYAWYGTNEYNFEVLADPPTCEPTRCVECKGIIRLAEDGYAMTKRGRLCEDCHGSEIPPFTA